MNRTRLLSMIFNSVWALHPQTATGYLPFVERILKGDTLPNDNKEEGKVKSMYYRTKSDTLSSRYELNGSNKAIAVHTFHDVITKFDTFCGPQGTLTTMRNMRYAEQNPNIIGHIIDIDSGGGEGTNINEIARMIRNEVKKPIIATFNGMCCSAAYGIASGADEIYATLNTDISGSIGVFITIADWKTYFEKQGLKMLDIYASQSTNKNDLFLEALNGNFEPLKTQLLDPFAAEFISMIKEMRPNASEDVFTGKIFMAKDAQDKGLIDGVKSFEEIVTMLFDKEEKNNNTSKTGLNNHKRTNMKIFGIELFKNKNGAFELSEEQAQAIQSAEMTQAQTTQKLEGRVTAIEERINAMNADLSKRIEALETWQEETPAVGSAKPQPNPQVSQSHAKIAEMNRKIGAAIRKN